MLSLFVILIYLLLQSYFDKKSKMVIKPINDAVLIISIALYFLRCGIEQVYPDIFGLSFLFLLFLLPNLILKKKAPMGIGDTKALLATTFLYTVQCEEWITSYSFSGKIDIGYPLCIFVIAGTLMSIVQITKGLLQKKSVKEIFHSKERVAFFPYLTAGYVLTTALYIFDALMKFVEGMMTYGTVL